MALSLLTSPLHASFEQLPTGARQAGLANSFTALADDVYATYYNPAGLVQLHRSEFSAFYSKLYGTLDDGSSISRSFVAYGHPTETRGTFGFSYLSLNLTGMYKENTMALHYAAAIKEKWNIGTSLKFLNKSYGSDTYTANAINSDTGASLGAPDPLFAQNGTSKSGISLDIGTQYRISKIYGLGFTILNLNSPNMALSSGDTDKVPSVYTVGLARRTKMSAIDTEVSIREFTDREYRFNMGGERWFNSGFGLRGGVGLGQRQYEVISFGASYRWEALQFDYALIYPMAGISGTFGTQQISMTFRFGRKK